MSHLDTAFQLGAHQARIVFNKEAGAAGELLARGMGAVRGTAQKVSPEMKGLAKRLGIGGGVGAATGAAAAGEDNRGMGALLGGLGGAGLGAGAGKLLEQRALGQIARQATKDVTSGAAKTTTGKDLLRALTQGQRDVVRSSAFPMGIPQL